MRLAILALLVAVQPVGAQRQDDFRWTGTLSAGRIVEISGVNGRIEARPASGREIEVTAVKRGRRSDPREVEIQVVDHSDGVTICAVYPTDRGNRPNECRPGGGGRNNTNNNDVEVNFTVRLPAGLGFSGRTVNGAVTVTGADGDVTASSVNGDVEIETTGHASARTVNGTIRARMGNTDWRGETTFSTVNGNVILDLPANASFDISASTVNGDISTDFPIIVQGRFGARRLSGTVGGGGRMLRVSTVNGDMTLRKR